jgi:hypothetical protein
MKPISFLFCLAIGICVISGCGSSQQGVTQIPAEASPALTETHAMIIQASYGDAPLNSLQESITTPGSLTQRSKRSSRVKLR